MGVARIPVGNVTPESIDQILIDFMMSRKFRLPPLGIDWAAAPGPPGRRLTGASAPITLSLDRQWRTSHHISIPASNGANTFFEIGEGYHTRPTDIGELANGAFAYPWTVAMTLGAPTIGGAGGAQGECFQGIGYGSPLTSNPPFLGNTYIAPFFYLIYNFTLLQWELIAFGGAAQGPTFKKVLDVQPSFVNGGAFRDVQLRFIPGDRNTGNKLQAWIDGKLCGQILDSRIDGLVWQDSYPISTYVLSTGSNAATVMNNAHYYYWRVYQPIDFDATP